LRTKVFNSKESRPFFAGLLPDAEKRDLVALALGVSKRNDFALLSRLGGDCAGAITLLPAEPRASTRLGEAHRLLGDEDIERILKELPRRPLLAGEKGVRLSLAGAQDKLPVLRVDGRLALPLDSTPSSHIMKGPIRHFEGTVQNEAFCLGLAASAGLRAISAVIEKAGRTEYLLVERYDRRRDNRGRLQRIHQEDFCQALGRPPELKYQSEGGPSLKDCFALVRRTSSRPVVDLAHLLDAVVFNLLIGNNDAHGKNFSLLYSAGGPELAPLYDLSCTAVYPELSEQLAMKVGDADRFKEVRSRHWEQLAKAAQLGPAQMKRRAITLAQALPVRARSLRQAFSALGHREPILAAIEELISNRSGLMLRTFGM
jgi:serine/threonine-protein kinase HipA